VSLWAVLERGILLRLLRRENQPVIHSSFLHSLTAACLLRGMLLPRCMPSICPNPHAIQKHNENHGNAAAQCSTQLGSAPAQLGKGEARWIACSVGHSLTTCRLQRAQMLCMPILSVGSGLGLSFGPEVHSLIVNMPCSTDSKRPGEKKQEQARDTHQAIYGESRKL